MMKKKIYFVVLILICSCGSSRYLHRMSYEDTGFYLYNRIDGYYYSYLCFPKTIEEFQDFLWDILNRMNNYKFNSLDEYMKSKDRIRNFEVEGVINFLSMERKKISVSSNDEEFILSFNGDSIQLRKDLCKEKSRPWKNKLLHYNFFTYDSIGKLSKEDYKEDYLSIVDELSSKYPKVYKVIDGQDTIPKYYMLCFQSHKGISSLCTDDFFETKNSYIDELTLLLDSFINENKDIDKMIFLLPIRYKENH